MGIWRMGCAQHKPVVVRGSLRQSRAAGNMAFRRLGLDGGRPKRVLPGGKGEARAHNADTRGSRSVVAAVDLRLLLALGVNTWPPRLEDITWQILYTRTCCPTTTMFSPRSDAGSSPWPSLLLNTSLVGSPNPESEELPSALGGSGSESGECNNIQHHARIGLIGIFGL